MWEAFSAARPRARDAAKQRPAARHDHWISRNDNPSGRRVASSRCHTTRLSHLRFTTGLSGLSRWLADLYSCLPRQSPAPPVWGWFQRSGATPPRAARSLQKSADRIAARYIAPCRETIAKMLHCAVTLLASNHAGNVVDPAVAVHFLTRFLAPSSGDILSPWMRKRNLSHSSYLLAGLLIL